MSEIAETQEVKTIRDQARELAGENGRTMLSLIDPRQPLALPVDVEKALLNPSNPESLIINSEGIVEHPPHHKTKSGEWWWRLGQVIGILELRTKKDGEDIDPEAIFWTRSGYDYALNLKSGEIFYVPKYISPRVQQDTRETSGYLEAPTAEEFKGLLFDLFNSPDEPSPTKIPPDWLEKELETIQAEKPGNTAKALTMLSSLTEDLNVPRQKFEGGEVDIATRHKLLDFISQNQEHLVSQAPLLSSQ